MLQDLLLVYAPSSHTLEDLLDICTLNQSSHLMGGMMRKGNGVFFVAKTRRVMPHLTQFGGVEDRQWEGEDNIRYLLQDRLI